VKTLNPLDLKLKLLAGEPWKIEGVGTLYPPTLKDIVKIGYSTYSQYVNVLLIDPKTTLGDKVDSIDGISGFDIIELVGDDELIGICSDAVKFFFRVTEVNFSNIMHQLYIGEVGSDKALNRDTYNIVKEVLELVACAKSVDDKVRVETPPANEHARAIQEKLKKRKEILAKKKSGNSDEDAPDLNDIISAVTVKSNSTNKINVWDYTMYQLFDEFRRLQIVDSYDSSILFMTQVGSDKIDLKHWSIPIKNTD
jgi:hypothetical protein